MNTVYTLNLFAELGNLSTIRDFVQDSTASLNIDDDAISDIVLAVDEIVTNIIVHGYCGAGGPIKIEIRRDSNSVIVQLIDQAQPFDPTSIPAPDINLPLEERNGGGLGLFLTRQLMDEIFYDLSPRGENHLTMIKEG